MLLAPRHIRDVRTERAQREPEPTKQLVLRPGPTVVLTPVTTSYVRPAILAPGWLLALLLGTWCTENQKFGSVPDFLFGSSGVSIISARNLVYCTTSVDRRAGYSSGGRWVV